MTQTFTTTPTYDLKPGDTIHYLGFDYEVFDTVRYNRNEWAVQVFLPSGSSRTLKGAEFRRVVR